MDCLSLTSARIHSFSNTIYGSIQSNRNSRNDFPANFEELRPAGSLPARTQLLVRASVSFHSIQQQRSESDCFEPKNSPDFPMFHLFVVEDFSPVEDRGAASL